MARHALLIGVSEYGEGIDPLPGSLHDVRRMAEALNSPSIGCFDYVKTVENPVKLELEEEIEHFFLDKSSDELLLFYFSGHGDLGFDRHQPHLHFCASQTRKREDGKLRESTAMSANTLKRQMDHSDAGQIIVILDCCYSSDITQFFSKGDSAEDFMKELKAPGRAILTSSGRKQVSFQYPDGLSVYTSCLIEGLEGKAQNNDKPWITTQDLHRYIKKRMRNFYVESDLKKQHYREPKPDILVVGNEGYNIAVAKAPQAGTSVHQFINNSSHSSEDQVSKGSEYVFPNNSDSYESDYFGILGGCQAIFWTFVGTIVLIGLANISSPRSQYTIQPGDSLTKIAEAQLGDKRRINELLEANPGLKRSSILIPGQSINIPSNSTPNSSLAPGSSNSVPPKALEDSTANSNLVDRLNLYTLDASKANTAVPYATIDRPENFAVITRKSTMSLINIPDIGEYWVLNVDIDK